MSEFLAQIFMLITATAFFTFWLLVIDYCIIEIRKENKKPK